MSKKKNKTISIPTELFSAVENYRDVNWSEVAAEAFRRHVNLLEKGRIEMSTIDRLRESKRESESKEFEFGKEVGEHWATKTASYQELCNLDEMRTTMQYQRGYDPFSDDDGGAYSSAEGLYFEIAADESKDRQAATDFWKDVCLEFDVNIEEMGPEAVRGFFEGALRIFDDVKDEL